MRSNETAQEPKPVMTPFDQGWQDFYKEMASRLICPGTPKEEIVSGERCCDHTYSRAVEILSDMGYDVTKSLAYFQYHSGYCDCEVLLNVQEAVRDAWLEER